MTDIDPGSLLGRQIAAALRMSELGTANPYALSYAGLGHSGPSFGIFQADMAANVGARACMRSILVNAGMAQINAASIVSQLGIACLACPISTTEETAVVAAMSSDAGRKMIDALDLITLQTVLGYVGRALDAAASANMAIEDGATLAIALWANMTGAPTTLDEWLSGETVAIDGKPLDPPTGATVTQGDVETYLEHTLYFEQHQRNLAHLQASVAAGLAVTC